MKPTELIEKQINLPSPPTIAVQILNTVQNAECSLDDLERIISADPALTSKMLRIANSAFYALPQEISNVSRALSVLGTNVIKNIALSFVIASDQRGPESSFFDYTKFWRRSVTSAVAAEIVMDAIQVKDDDIFVTSLLQNIGVLVLAQAHEKSYTELLKNTEMDGDIALLHAEHEMFGIDHQSLGFHLLEDWGIPQSISSPIRYHHEPDKAEEGIRTRVQVLHIASLLSDVYNSLETGENVRYLQKMMQDNFRMSPENTAEILDDVALKSIDVLAVFEIDPGDMKPYSQILQEANDELGKLNLSYEQLVLELKESKEKSERFANKLRLANKKLEELAFKDGLTNLYNHRYFQEVFAKEMARARRYNHPLSLILFDIDYFKKVNDTYGHPAGDQVLKNLSIAISKAIRPSDILARYGGEEFAVLLPETSKSGLKVFAERLRRCAATTTTESGAHKIDITISCGGVEFLPEGGMDQQTLLDIADKGLYHSKANGRNRVTIMPLEDSP